MAENASDNVIWLLQIPEQDTEFLAGIRHWEGLQLARAEGAVWVAGLTTAQVKMPAVLSVPDKNIWQQREDFLFKTGDLLPQKRMPELEWQDLQNALPLTLPAQNFNFFGVRERMPMQLVRSEKEQPIAALLLPLKTLHSYIQTAPAVRLQGLSWTVLKGINALILGTPILPLPGKAFWKCGGLLLPAGFNLQWPALLQTVVEAQELETPNSICIWEAGGNRMWIKETDFQMLSISSYRQTMQRIDAQKNIRS